MNDRDTATHLAIAYLRQQGYSVTPPQTQGMVRPAELGKMAGSGLTSTALWRRLHHVNCPPYEKILGPGGRLTWLKPNPALVSYIAQPKRRGQLTLVA
jgi:hypothetical protein